MVCLRRKTPLKTPHKPFKKRGGGFKNPHAIGFLKTTLPLRGVVQMQLDYPHPDGLASSSPTTTPYTSALCYEVIETGHRLILAPLGRHTHTHPTMKLPASIVAASTKTWGGHKGTGLVCTKPPPPPCAAAIPLPATMSVCAVRRRPVVTHAHVPAQNTNATFLGLPYHTNLRRIRRKVLRVQWGKANLTHLVTQSVMAKGFGAILRACAPMSVPIEATCLHVFSENL